MPVEADLDVLHEQSESIGAVQAPLIVAFGLALMAVLGFMAESAMLGIVGWFGGFLVGFYAIGRAADVAEIPVLVKIPAMIAVLVPGLAVIATGAIWWMTRQTALSTAGAIQRLKRAAAQQKSAAAARLAAAARPTADTPANIAAPAPAASSGVGTRATFGSPAQAAAPAPAKSSGPAPESALPVVRGVLLQPAKPDTPIKYSLPQRPAGMSDADWALFENAIGPVTRPTGHFLVMYRMDNGANWLYVNEDVREESGLTPDGLHRKAMLNLLAILQRPNQLRRIENPPYMGFLLDGDHESSLVLIDDLWRQMIRMDCPNGVVVAIPARDICAFCDAGSPEGIIALREMIARMADAPGRVTDELLRFDGERWSIFR